jgi:carbonic anhydrase/acetyltransferase-like protein (isoleucine patch superfamily)
MPNIRPFRGQFPRIAEGVWIDDTALVIGDVTIGRDSSLWPHVVARGDINRITIGSRTNVQDGSVLHVSHAGPFNPEGAAVVIGDAVTVGHRVTLHGCRIGDRCLIGMGAIVLDRAVVAPVPSPSASSPISTMPPPTTSSSPPTTAPPAAEPPPSFSFV